MELPFNTTISADMLHGHDQFEQTGRELGHAAPLGRRGVRGARTGRLHDRQRLHGREGSGTDEVPLPRSPLAGRGPRRPRRGLLRPRQRRARPEPGYLGDLPAAIDRGELPLGRAYRPTPDERLIREVILQLKRGAVRPSYFAGKFGVDIHTGSRTRGNRSRATASWPRARPTASPSRARACCASTCCCSGSSWRSTSACATPRSPER